jgi:hypothetical protein
MQRYFLLALAAISPATTYASLDGLSGTGTDFFLALISFIALLIIIIWSIFKFVKLLLNATKKQRIKVLGFLLVAFVFWYVLTGFLYFILLFVFSRASAVDFWHIPLMVLQTLFEFPWPRAALSFFIAIITLLINAKIYRSKNGT